MGFDVGLRLELISARREIKERGEQIVRLRELLKLALDYVPENQAIHGRGGVFVFIRALNCTRWLPLRLAALAQNGPELRQKIESELRKWALENRPDGAQG